MTTNHIHTEPSGQGGPSRRRAILGLLALGVAAAAVAALVILVLATREGSPGSAGDDTDAKDDSVGTESRPRLGERGDQDQAEYDLATKPMLRLPARAALPQPMSQSSAGEPITLPQARQRAGVTVPSGFDTTPQGALARLVALNEAGLATGTPRGYAQLYASMSEPGAPPGRWSWQAVKLRGIYEGAELDPASAEDATRVRMEFTATHGLIKGATGGGAYVVVCVLGELTIAAGERAPVRAGAGDCQAMRHTERGWLIASGTPAYPAPSPWPGSADSVRAGYRELERP